MSLQGDNSNCNDKGGWVRTSGASVEMKEREDKDEALQRKKTCTLRELTSGERT